MLFEVSFLNNIFLEMTTSYVSMFINFKGEAVHLFWPFFDYFLVRSKNWISHPFSFEENDF